MSDLPGLGSYLDFQGLTALRAEAGRDQSKSLRKVAEQFEAHFVQEVMKCMRQATFKDDLMQSDAADTYQDMMDKELAVQIAKRGGLGLADMLERQLVQRTAVSTQEALQGRGLPLQTQRRALPLGPEPLREFSLPRAAAAPLPLKAAPMVPAAVPAAAGEPRRGRP